MAVANLYCFPRYPSDLRISNVRMEDDDEDEDVAMPNVLEEAWRELTSDAAACKSIDLLLTNKSSGAMTKEEVMKRAARTTKRLREAWFEHLATQPIENLSDDRLRSYMRYTDGLPLKDYENALDLVPELVNLVSLADALPLDGSGLPFDLKRIAARCKTAVYFAPRRFTAVQLAFDEPRSRVLLFHTGRVVGTGCNSPTAAKLAVIRALKTIAFDAGVHVAVRRFAVINEVGAIALGARLDCHAMANTHSSTSHYDPKSFVGLAWRPVGECICSEIYSTGKSNLPGSRRERHLLRSFARMAPELLRHSDNPEKAQRFAEHLREAHRPSAATQLAPVAAPTGPPPSSASFWDAEDIGPGFSRKRMRSLAMEDEDEEEDDADGLLGDSLGSFL